MMASGPYQGCMSLLGEFYENKHIQNEDKGPMFMCGPSNCPQSILRAYPDLCIVILMGQKVRGTEKIIGLYKKT